MISTASLCQTIPFYITALKYQSCTIDKGRVTDESGATSGTPMLHKVKEKGALKQWNGQPWKTASVW